MNTDSAWLQCDLVTSNRTLFAITDPSSFDQDQTYYTMTINVLADMDANDTAFCRYYLSGGTAQVDLEAHSYFSGYLAC